MSFLVLLLVFGSCFVWLSPRLKYGISLHSTKSRRGSRQVSPSYRVRILRKIHERFTKDSRKIHERFTKDSRKIHDSLARLGVNLCETLLSATKSRTLVGAITTRNINTHQDQRTQNGNHLK